MDSDKTHDESSPSGHTAAAEKKIQALSYVGPIESPWAVSLRSALCGLANENVTDLVLLISSIGGSTMEGFALYNLMRSLPFNIHTHNLGAVNSIANIVYIAGDYRSMSPQSSFMFHSFSFTFEKETLDEAQLTERVNSLSSGRAEFIQIFEGRTNWGSKDFDERRLFDRAQVIGPDEALKAGICHEITPLFIPRGVPILNVVP